MKFWQTFREFSLLVIIMGILTGCGAASRHYNSSVVDYLYPNQTEPIESPTIPRLSLPIRVGIAFVPDNPARTSASSSDFWKTILAEEDSITEKEKFALMQEVGDHFKNYEFVKSIDFIPSAYLRPRSAYYP